METKTFSVQINGEIKGVKITPKNLDIRKLKGFLDDITDLLALEQKATDNDIVVLDAIEEGSLIIKVLLPVFLFNSLAAELEQVSKDSSLINITPKRAEVLYKLQEGAKKDKLIRNLSYDFSLKEKKKLSIGAKSEFSYKVQSAVSSTLPLFGMITKVGGEDNKAIIEIKDEEMGKVQVSCDQERLDEENKKKNLLYSVVGIRTRAKLDTMTGRYSDFKFLEFFERTYNSSILDNFAKEGAAVWKDVPESWLRELRGNYE